MLVGWLASSGYAIQGAFNFFPSFFLFWVVKKRKKERNKETNPTQSLKT